MSFCGGTRGSPGGPRAIAALMKIVADDMQERGVTIGGGEAEPVVAEVAVETKKKPKKPSTFAARAGAALATTAEKEPTGVHEAELVPGLKHMPSEMEKAADPAGIQKIRDKYGSRTQTIINSLLAFDAYFSWYYHLKYGCPPLFEPDMSVKEEAAFANCCKAIDMHEAFERLAIRQHGSFLPHGMIFKVTRDILAVGDV